MRDPIDQAAVRIRRGRRRGDSLPAILVTLALLGGFGAAAVVITPGVLHGGPAPRTPRPPSDPGHLEVTETLERVIGGSHALLAVHPRGRTAFLEIVLWLEDGKNPGLVDATEVLVLSYSPVLQSLTAHAFDAEGEAAVEAGPPGPWLPAAAARASFCDAWRADRRGRRMVIESSLSDMRVERIAREDGGADLLEITLTWSANSSDAQDEATVYVEVAARLENDKED